MVIPEGRPPACVQAVLLLKRPAQALGREDEEMLEAEVPQVGDQVEQEVGGDRAQRRVLVLTSVVSRIADAEEDELAVRRSSGQCRIHHSGRLEVAA